MAGLSTGASAQITPFNFGTHAVRVVVREGEPWFVASDVCSALGYRDAEKGTRNLGTHQKGSAIVRTLGGNQALTVINESGLYRLVLRSRKPEAEKFSDWVTGEVLPSIRKTGSYAVQPSLPAPDLAQAYQAASAIGAQVQQAVFAALMAAGPDWKHERWLLNLIPRDLDGDELVPNIVKVARNACVGPTDQFPDFIDHSLTVKNDVLQAIASAAMQKLARRANLGAPQAGTAVKVIERGGVS